MWSPCVESSHVPHWHQRKLNDKAGICACTALGMASCASGWGLGWLRAHHDCCWKETGEVGGRCDSPGGNR
eukprot:scaffold1453_cov19-Tisochrysis_lutea.AAC.1